LQSKTVVTDYGTITDEISAIFKLMEMPETIKVSVFHFLPL